MILFNENAEAATAQIAALQTRRATIAANLTRVSDALAALTGETPTLEDLLNFLGMRSKSAVEEWILEIWLEKEGIQLPGKKGLLTTAVELPDVGKAAVEAWEAAQLPKSEDWSRYQTKKGYAPPPVSDEEKEGIRERNRRYIGNEADAAAFEFMRNVAHLMTRCGQNGQEIVPGKVSMYSEWMRPFLKGSRPQPETGQVVSTLTTPYAWEVNEEAFFVNHAGRDYRAFDEFKAQAHVPIS